MSNPKKGSYLRAQADILAARLREPRRFLQIVTGPRQVGKTTLVEQVVAGGGMPHLFVSGDRFETVPLSHWSLAAVRARRARRDDRRP
jgi:predicted AAA+ superfamily ATPase